MISKRKGEDLTELISGPLGFFIVALVVIGIGVGVADYIVPDEDIDEGDDQIQLFAFFTNVSGQIKSIMYTVATLVIIGGSIFVGLILALHPPARKTHS